MSGCKYRKIVDWEAMLPDWIAGIKTVLQLSKEYDVSRAAIVKHWAELGIDRDLSAKIRAKADSIIRKSEVTKKVALVTEFDVVEANANISAAIQLSERKDVSKARSIAMRMFEEIEDQTNDVDGYVKVGEILATENTKAMQDRFNKAIGFSGRVDNMKKLADTLKTLIDLERKVNKIDTDPEGDENKKVNLVVNFK